MVQNSVATPMGYLKPENKFLRSTKKQLLPIPSNLDYQPTQQSKQSKQYIVMSDLFEFNSKQMAYSDMTGSFPYKSTRGNSYIYIFYDYDANAILVKAVPNRQAGTIKKILGRTLQ